MKGRALAIDDIIEKRIQFGSYQVRAFFALSLVDLIDGLDIISMSLIIPMIQSEFDLSKFSISILSSIFYLGMIFGAILTGNLSDTFGRKRTIVLSGSLQCLVAIGFYFANHSVSILILRFLYGFCYGFSMPLSVASITEIVPVAYRGKSVICMNFFTSVGKLVALVLAYFCLEDMTSGNWRLLMLLNGVIALFGPIMIAIFFLESPRYLIAKGNFDVSFDPLPSSCGG